MILIPCLGAILLLRWGEKGFRVIGVGGIGFVLSQVGHLPFNRFLLLPGLEWAGVDLAVQAGGSLWVLALAVGLSAGVFEEGARYLIFRFWLRGQEGSFLPWKYGVGHGGIEAIGTGLLVLYALVQVLALENEGVLGGFPADQAVLIRSQLEAYWAVPWQEALLGAWERVSSLLFHLGASVFVYKSVRERKIIWLGVAVLGHTALNGFAVVAVGGMGLLLVELLLFVVALVWVVWAWFVRPRFAPQAALVPPPSKPSLSSRQITIEQIEESRYE